VKRASARAWNAALFAAALAASGWLKAGYSRAGASELDFLLAPTARGVELLSGHAFPKEAGAGYVNLELGIAIAPACAGVNFLIVAFAALVFGFVPRCGTPARKLSWFAASAALATFATLVVNTCRITLSLAKRSLAPSGFLSPAAAHRALGVVVYLGCLLVLYAAVEAGFRRGVSRGSSYAVPLACYLGVTLLVPLLRGAAARPDYATHASVVLLAAGGAGLLLQLGALAGRRRKAAVREQGAPRHSAP
jgi:exosortase K